MGSRARRAGAGAVAGLLLAPQAAVGHVVPEPPFVTRGEATTVSFTVQNERARHDTVELQLAPPPRVELRPAAPPPGWTAVLDGETLRWRGGRIAGGATVSFPARVTADAPAGSYAFRAVQRYEDGERVSWEAPFTVLPGSRSPAPQQQLRRAVVAGAVGLVLVAASLLALHALRGRRLQGGR